MDVELRNPHRDVAHTTASVQITLANVVLTNVSSTKAAGTVTLSGTMTFTAAG